MTEEQKKLAQDIQEKVDEILSETRSRFKADEIAAVTLKACEYEDHKRNKTSYEEVLFTVAFASVCQCLAISGIKLTPHGRIDIVHKCLESSLELLTNAEKQLVSELFDTVLKGIKDAQIDLKQVAEEEREERGDWSIT